ncbi:MAG TPA: HRDC domain-containing protein [Geobacteraceae bacterium]|nr:HRDC domain-containing protein [Geobacteraceae bacterium]
MKNNKMPEIVSSQQTLLGLVERLAREPLLAVDLEADSLHHYQEKVCLIQISTPTESVILDPLAIPDLSPLAPILADPAIRKVFHGADYDIRSLYRDFGIEVQNLFDTMIACQFLGEKEVGLAAVLFKRFGAELDKRYQKADWSIRPLSDEMIEYAVRDTSLLIELYRQLTEELHDKGRLAWVEEESALLTAVRAGSRDVGPLFLRFKGAAKMDPRTLAVLEELLRFRDNLARARNLPPFKILGSDTLRQLAEIKPHRPGDLEGIAGFTAKLSNRYGREILEATARGLSLPSDQLPSYPHPQRFVKDRLKGERLRRLKLWREAKAKKLGIEAGVLVNNSMLESVVASASHGKEGIVAGPAMKQWQKEAFGEELMKLVNDPDITA